MGTDGQVLGKRCCSVFVAYLAIRIRTGSVKAATSLLGWNIVTVVKKGLRDSFCKKSHPGCILGMCFLKFISLLILYLFTFLLSPSCCLLLIAS